MSQNYSGYRRTRVMISGEFSAGKTRLINCLLGRNLLPSHVVSTSLPPIWLSYGDAPGFVIDLEDNRLSFDGLDSLDIRTTKYSRLFFESTVLQHIDLIDTPGNSDPNIPSICWERMLDYADMIIWCSNSVQAWRQSEKSAWQEIPEHIADKSILLLTHADRLETEQARGKVLRRVRREAIGMFRDIHMISLTSKSEVADFTNELVKYAKLMAELPEEGSAFLAPSPVQLVGPSARETLANIFAEDRPMGMPQLTGEARATWDRIARDADLNDPATLRACVETLLASLEGRQSENPMHTEQKAAPMAPLSRVNER